MKQILLMVILAGGLLLTACSTTVPVLTEQPVVEPVAQVAPQADAATKQNPESQSETINPAEVPELGELSDSQGAVTVVVKPSELDPSAGNLVFEIAMDTHSIDLSMDLAALATLTTDTGFIVQAETWDAPVGGHHVSGTLSFPDSLEGKGVLDGASRLTLTIKDVDAPERIFAWDLN